MLRSGTAILIGLIVTGCAPVEQTGSTLRLIDLFPEATVSGTPAGSGGATAALEWNFAEIEEGRGGWQTHGVRDLRLAEGRLRGQTSGKTALIYAEPAVAFDETDLLHALEIAMRVDSPGELSARFDSEEEFDPEIGLFPWPLKSPLLAGDEIQRYTLTPARPLPMEKLRRLVLQPTDAEGARFEIESLRIVTRREHLAAIDSGIGWHGMDDIFQESIVTRAPETVRYSMTLPPRAWLDLSLATVEEGAATFHIEVQEGDDEPLHFERTVSRPHRWYRARLPLAGLGGKEVTLALRLESERDGFLGFWGTAAVRSALDAPMGERPQGVIVVLADTLRADHVNALGYSRETAPFLTSLAAEGTLAQDCITQGTWTKVSVPAIFTSLYATTHTVAEFDDRLPVGADTLAESFREAGYATLALTSIPFVGQFTNLHQGYEELHEAASLRESPDSKTSREYIDRLLPWLESHRDVPFFVFLHVADPHSPYRAYAPFDSYWGGEGEADKLSEYTELARPHIEDPLMQRFGMATRGELEQAGVDADEYVGYELDAYDGSIRAMDIEMARLFERLRELDLADDTLVAFVSDHGTEFLDHDKHFHGHSVYGELNRVPMFLWSPGRVPAGVELEPTVQTIDLMPTILEIAGLELPERTQGQSLMSLMRAAAEGREQRWQHPAITEKAKLEGKLPGREFGSVSLIADGLKLIHNEPQPQGVPEYELYDHRDDPLNLQDLAAERPEDVARLTALLEQWREQAQAARFDEDAVQAEMSAEELERLRSLGYLQ